MLLDSWLARWRAVRFPMAPRIRRPRQTTHAAASAYIQRLEPRVLLTATAIGTEFQVNTTTSGSQSSTISGPETIGMDALGNFVVVWDDDDGVFGQQFYSDGTPRGTEFQITNDGVLGTVEVSDGGEFVVAWQNDSAQDGSGRGIFARRYAADGSASGSAFAVNTFTTGDQRLPTLAMDAAGNFVIAWNSNLQDGSSMGIYAQRYDAGGIAQGSEFLVNTHTTNAQQSASAAMDADGDFVIAWESLGQDGDGFGVYAQRFDAQGIAQGGEFQVHTSTTGYQTTPAVAMDADGDFVIAWDDGGDLDGDGYGIFAQRYNAAGVAQGGEFQVNTYTSDWQTTSGVAMDANGDFVITWTSWDQEGSLAALTGVYAQQFDALGTPQGSEFHVNTWTTDRQRFSSVAMNVDGDFVITWETYDQDGHVFGIYAQRYVQPGVAAVTEVLSAGEPVEEAERLASMPTSLTVGFSRSLNTTNGAAGTNSVLNPNNWILTRDGVDVTPQITGITFGYNGATGQHEATLTFAAALAEGDYELTVDDAILDLSGEPLDGDGNSTAGGDFTQTFAVRVPVPFGGEFQVNTYTTEVQQFGEGSRQTIAADAAGNFVITWSSYGQDGDCYGVYAQRYNAAGVKQGGEFQVNTTTTGHQFDSSVAMDDAGNFIVTWTDLGQDGDAGGIYAQRYNAAGVAQGGEFLVNTTTTSDQIASTVAMDADGDFVVTWSSYDQDGEGYGVYAQRYNAGGIAQGTEFQVNTYTTDYQFNSTIAMDADGDFVIVWASYYQDGDAYGVFAQRYNASGVAQGAEFQVNTFTTSTQQYAGVAMDADGDFVVTWTSYGPDGDGLGVMAQRYNAAGVAQGTEFQVNTFTTGLQLYSSVAMDVDGDFVIAWTDFGQNNYDVDVYGQRYDAAGVAQGTEFRVNTYTSDEQLDPQVAMDADGDFMIAWMSYDQDGDSLGIYAQRYHDDTAPVLNNASFTISENRPNGYVVGTLAATDVDFPAGDVLTYAITAGNTGNAFSINAAGQITVNTVSAVDFEVNPTFSLTVEVTDSAMLTDTATVSISLNNLNEAPYAFSKSFTIAENLPVGTVIGTINTGDQDVGQTVTYSLTGGNTGNAFLINSITGEISVNNVTPLNFEVNPTFTLLITAKDNGSPQQSRIGTAVVTLLDLNEPPAFVAPTTFTISENRPVGYAVGVVNILDPEGNSVTYSLVGGDPNQQFAINANTGQITVAKATINFETTPQFLLQVRAEDNGTPSASRTQTITVNVTNLNEPPVFAAPTTFSIAENRPVGYDVGTVHTVDPEANAVTYSLVGGDPNNQFAINGTTGQITVAKATINYETTPQFLLQVQATDNGSPATSRTQTITVNVTNLNEPPVFAAPTTFTITENRPIGYAVGMVHTVDPEGNTVTYSLVGGDPNGQFAINAGTGQITVAKATIDHEATPQFLLQVKAQDNGSPSQSRTQTITVNVTNLNEPPVFAAPIIFTVPENQLNGAVVGTLVTVDPEANAVTYSLTAGNTNNAFAIHATTGQITVNNAAALDFETTPQFVLSVKAQDNGSPSQSRTQTITIHVTNIAGARVPAKKETMSQTAAASGTTGQQFVLPAPSDATPSPRTTPATEPVLYSFTLFEPLAAAPTGEDEA